MGNEINFAIDKNLGFVIEDEIWQQFFKKFNIKTVMYDDMKKLTEDMEKNRIIFSYLPAANFFYFKSDKFYTPIANALFSANQTTKISSLLIVSKESSINSLSELKNKTLGYIHPYCTSSYFAPALLLWRNHYSIHDFFSSMKQVGAWQLQIDAVIAKKVDATMIQEDVWYKLPENAEKTKIISREDNLPSPLVLCANQIEEKLINEFKEILFTYKPKSSVNSLFNGFVPFQKDQVEAFFSASTLAFS